MIDLDNNYCKIICILGFIFRLIRIKIFSKEGRKEEFYEVKYGHGFRSINLQRSVNNDW